MTETLASAYRAGVSDAIAAFCYRESGDLLIGPDRTLLVDAALYVEKTDYPKTLLPDVWVRPVPNCRY